MAIDRIKAKGRRASGPFVAVPLTVLNHPNYIALTAKSVKLLNDMLAQMRFRKDGTGNNGDLSMAWSIMSERGWKSKQTLANARKELEVRGFITQTRQGGRHKCSLYAITWWAIDYCDGKLDVPETRVPSNEWKQVQ